MSQEAKQSRKAFADLITVLAEAWRQKITQTTIHAYWFGLSDIEPQKIEQAIGQAIRTCKFMPSVQELRELCGVFAPEQRSVIAWDAVLRAVPLGSYRHVDFDDPAINASIRSFGGWPDFLTRMGNAGGAKWARHQFIQTYERLTRHGQTVTGDSGDPLPGLSECQVAGGEITPPKPRRITTGLEPLPALPDAHGTRAAITASVKRLPG